MSDYGDASASEAELKSLFAKIQSQMNRIERVKDAEKKTQMLKAVQQQLLDAKQLIKDFERDARADGMASNVLSKRKKELVDQLNNFIVTAKSYRPQKPREGSRGNAGGFDPNEEGGSKEDFYSNQQLQDVGRKKIKETDQRLDRMNRVVEGTIQIGQTTAETLKGQTEQMERIVNDLEDVHFNLKKASQMIRDITRTMATDKCIMGIFVLIVAGVVAIVVLRAKGTLGGKKLIVRRGPPPPPAAPPPPRLFRRRLMDRKMMVEMLMDTVQQAATEVLFE